DRHPALRRRGGAPPARLLVDRPQAHVARRRDLQLRLAPVLRRGDGGAARRVRARGPLPARGGDVLPHVRGPRPRRCARHADRRAGDDVPRHGRHQVAQELPRPDGHAARRARHRQRPPRLRRVPGRVGVRGLPRGPGAVRRVRHVVGPRAGVVRAGAARHGLRHRRLRDGRPDAVGGGLRADLPSRGDPADPVLGVVLPDRQPGTRARLGGAAHPAVARGRPHPDALPGHGRLAPGRPAPGGAGGHGRARLVVGDPRPGAEDAVV
ncbi:MAG: Efflux ABC transporter, permease protein, partial [uncultured Nocardioides sp.]